MIPRKKAFYQNNFKSYIVQKNYDIPIYHFLCFDHLLYLLKNQRLWINQIKLWDDVYEHFLAKSKHLWGSTPISYHSHISGFYGQCWTLKKESDALWRIYSNDKKSVRIKSRINKVLESSLNEFYLEPFSLNIRTTGYIDQVNYFSKNQIIKWIKKENEGFINIPTILESLFIKRKEFAHENEVRFIIHKNIDPEEEIKGIEHSHLQIVIDPNYLIEEITFDPRITDDEFKVFKYVIEKMGFINKITKSKLYDFDLPTFRK